MSPCLSVGRTFSIDLDIVNPSSPSSGRSSSPSSTLSESNNYRRTISFKKARSPRKRPNQNYNEAAALLSTIYPTIFSSKNSETLSKTATLASFPESSALLPPLPVLSDAAFLIRKPLPENQCDNADCELKHEVPVDREGTSPVSNVSWEPTLPNPFDRDLEAESILVEEVQEGIDSIMGKLSTKNSTNDDSIDSLNHLFLCLVESQVGKKIDFGLANRTNWQRALRERGNRDWWRASTVVIQDINRDFNPSAVSASGKIKEEEEEEEEVNKEEVEGPTTASNSCFTPSQEVKAGLGLKLSQTEVLKEWSDRGSMFADGTNSQNSCADVLAKLAEIELFPDCGNGSGGREARVLRYKEKRRSRLFSKKIRYQVRKVNAEQRPRMKGRFVRRPSLLPPPGRAPMEREPTAKSCAAL